MREEGVVPGGDEELRYAPDVFFGGHPVLLVEAREIDRTRVGAERTFAAKIVVVVEVAQGELTQSAVDGSTEAEACEVGLGDTAPETILMKDGENMVIVADCFEVHEQGWVPIDTKSCSCDESAFEAVSLAFAENALW